MIPVQNVQIRIMNTISCDHKNGKGTIYGFKKPINSIMHCNHDNTKKENSRKRLKRLMIERLFLLVNAIIFRYNFRHPMRPLVIR